MSGNIELYVRHDKGYDVRQRAFDISIAVIALFLTSPILLLVSLMIWLEDRGPIIFKQQRVGHYGKLFTIFKFRTMRVVECVDANAPSGRGDSRVTRVGRILRRTSLDELPQLFNVLGGEMSIVGPRPEMPFLVERYESWQHLRLLRKPGITGLWQVSCRKQVPLHTPGATKIDLEYVRAASTVTDARIFLRTFSSLVTTQGAF